MGAESPTCAPINYPTYQTKKDKIGISHFNQIKNQSP
jgi:hypothetical protein